MCYVVFQSPGHPCDPQAGISSTQQFACWSYGYSKVTKYPGISAEALSEKKAASPGLSLDVGKTFFGPVTLDKPDSFSCLCSPFGLSSDRVDLVSSDAVLESS